MVKCSRPWGLLLLSRGHQPGLLRRGWAEHAHVMHFWLNFSRQRHAIIVQLCMPGGACLSKFVGPLRELRDAGEMLHMQTDVALCERLQPWAEVETQIVPYAAMPCSQVP